MAVSLTVYDPDGTVTFTEGADDVDHIVVTFSFANVVHVKIYFDDESVTQYYQVPCKYETSP